MSMALCLTRSLSLAGQTSTHSPQPVQSSGATWMTIFQPGYSLPFQSAALKPSGGLGQQGRVECLHADRGVGAAQRAQPALDADLRVPDRECPGRCSASRTASCRWGTCRRTGMALTGRSSPRLAIIMPSTSLTNAGALAGTGGTMWNFEVTWPGTFTSWRAARAPSTAALFRWTIVPPPFFP